MTTNDHEAEMIASAKENGYEEGEKNKEIQMVKKMLESNPRRNKET